MAIKRILAALAATLAFSAQLLAAGPEPYRLTILHTNDIHAHIAEFDRVGQTCGPDESAKGDCFGGYPRLMAAVSQERKKGGNILLLDAGDQFQGTLFYSVLKGVPARECVNALRYNAVTLGNHEFDDGPKMLVDSYLDGLTAPVLAANVDASRFAPLKARVLPATIVNLGGRKIGLTGLANEETARLSNPGPDVSFADGEAPLRRAAKDLRAKGADIVVAITHVGLARDKELAAKVDGVDLIVGGHSHTLLSNTDPKAAGPYPVVVRSPSGRPVLIVQAEAWGKYLGELQVDFDGGNHATAWSGAPLLLDSSKPQDPALLAKVEAWQEQLKPFLAQAVGQAAAEFPPDCRFGECGLGDLMADAIRISTRTQGTQAAFINSGAVRAGLKAGPVSTGDLLTVYPFADTVATFELDGKDLLAVLEHSVSLADQPGATGTGCFLQVSGIKYSFDARRPQGQRIVTADILGADGGFSPIKPDKSYPLAANAFLLKGGDGYTMIRDNAKRVYAFGAAVSDVLADYVSSHSPVSPDLDGRIVRLSGALPQ
jgi:5'-nucleotidase